MAIIVIPRILTYSTFFASSFPIIKLKADDPLGTRFGLIVLACLFVVHAIAIAILSYVKVNKKKQLSKLESFFGGLINLLSPCLIQHQTSGMIGICSSFAIAHFAIRLKVDHAALIDGHILHALRRGQHLELIITSRSIHALSMFCTDGVFAHPN